jgi:hypothetical protein
MTTAGAPSASILSAVAEQIIASFYTKHFPIDQGLGKLSPGHIIHSLNGCAGNVHLIGALFLRKSI